MALDILKPEWSVVSCAQPWMSQAVTCQCGPPCEAWPAWPAPTLRVNTAHSGGRPHLTALMPHLPHTQHNSHTVTNESCSHQCRSPAVLLRSRTTLHCGPPLKANMDQHFRSITDKWIDAGCVHKVEHRFIIDCSHPSNLS